MSQHPAQIGDASRLPAAGSLASVVKFLQVVRLRKGIVACTLFVSLLLGGLYYGTATRLYQSSAELNIVRDSANVMEGNTDSQRVVQDFMPTYQKVLSSDVVLNRAIKALPPQHRVDLKGVPSSLWATTIRSGMSVSSARRTNVINVEYRSKSPATARAVVQNILSAYQEHMLEEHKDSAHEFLEVMERKERELSEQIQMKQTELMQLQRSSRSLVDTEERRTSAVVKAALFLRDALSDAERKTLEAEAFFFAVQRALQNGEDIQQLLIDATGTFGADILSAQTGLSSYGEVATSRVLTDLIETRSELSSLERELGPNHPRVKTLQQEIAFRTAWLEERPRAQAQKISDMRRDQLGPQLIQMAQQKLEYAQANEWGLRTEFEAAERQALALNGQMFRIDMIKADLDRMQRFYDALLEQMTNINLNKSTGLKTTVLKQPGVSRTPVSPRLTMTVLLCLIGGTSSGLAIIYVLDTLDDRFRSPDDLRLQLGVPVLAMVRDMEPTGGAGWGSVHTFSHPNGVESEAFRTLRTSLSFSGENSQRIVVTSTEPGDGKTTVLANLSVAFAQSGKKTILIDADMRRPGMTTMLGLRSNQGLSDVLRDTRTITECVGDYLVQGEVNGLEMLPAGPRPVNPAELLSSDRFSDLLAWAEANYDQVLVDAPPALAVADPAIIGKLVDGAILVVRPDKNRRRMVIRAAETFLSVNIHMFGVVVNHLTPDSGDDYYGFGYGYGYGYGYGHDDADTPPREQAGYTAGGQSDESQAGSDESDDHINFYRAA